MKRIVAGIFALAVLLAGAAFFVAEESYVLNINANLQPCVPVLLDFTIPPPGGTKLPAGTILGSNDPFGIEISGEGQNGINNVIVFDSDAAGTNDPGLVGIGNLAILPENIVDNLPAPDGDDLVDKPAASALGGKQIYEFADSRVVKSFVFVGGGGNGQVARFFDKDGAQIGSDLVIPSNGTVQTVPVHRAGVRLMEVEYKKSGGITDIDLDCGKKQVAVFLLIDEDGIDSDMKSLFPDPGQPGQPMAIQDLALNDPPNCGGGIPSICINEEPLDGLGDKPGRRLPPLFTQVVDITPFSGVIFPTGQIKDEGFFTLKKDPQVSLQFDEPKRSQNSFTTHELIQNEGNAAINDNLDKIAGVKPLRAAELKALLGRTVCALVYDSDISINYEPRHGNLKGATLGLTAFFVADVLQGDPPGTPPGHTNESGSDSSLPELVVDLLPSDQVKPTCDKTEPLLEKEEEAPATITINTAIDYGTVYPGQVVNDSFSIHLSQSFLNDPTVAAGTVVGYRFELQHVDVATGDITKYLVFKGDAGEGDAPFDTDLVTNPFKASVTKGSDETDEWKVIFTAPPCIGKNQMQGAVLNPVNCDPNGDGVNEGVNLNAELLILLDLASIVAPP